ncbi:hypothetical protein [Actinoalloteichus spitiensis]|uniref:hypothetical protein n=1 Tax=Actinoalloteichus spitiensis TaxID=252394 RepID=UPI00035D4040|nr:hypothetical protein [Actinoalloteichus spitiensis]
MRQDEELVEPEVDGRRVRGCLVPLLTLVLGVVAGTIGTGVLLLLLAVPRGGDTSASDTAPPEVAAATGRTSLVVELRERPPTLFSAEGAEVVLVDQRDGEDTALRVVPVPVSSAAAGPWRVEWPGDSVLVVLGDGVEIRLPLILE